MTPREKNLLIFLGVALFIILNLVGFNSFYSPAINKARGAKTIAEGKLEEAERVLSQSAELEPEIQWLERTGTVVTNPPVAQSKLQALLRKQASARNLDIRDSRILPYQPGLHYDRVRVLFKVTGMELDVFSWLTSIHQPTQRQVVTKMEMKPQNNDPTRVECEIEVDKCIITPDDV
jgi:type II secretory pathway component PulM